MYTLNSFIWFLVYAAGFVVFLVLTQDLHIYPGALFSIVKSRRQKPGSIPRGVESLFLKTPDGPEIEIWRLPAQDEENRKPFAALVFHGNGGTLEHFLFPQLWFSELGIASYGFDYRGFGHSSGWPSERGINIDSDTVWQYIIQREQIEPARIIVCGISLGGAPAARIASLHGPRLLLLVSAFSSLKQVIRDRIWLRIVAPFCRCDFATADYVSKLSKTKLVIAHGLRDSVVWPPHAKVLAAAYRGSGGLTRLTSEDAGHNAAFYLLRRELAVEVTASLRNV